MYLNQFISFLTPAATSGGFSIVLSDTTNSNVFTMPVSGITTLQTEIDIAQSAQTQVQTQLYQYNLAYSGTPAFSGQSPAFTFRLFRTDHVLILWSEAYFRVSIANNTSGTTILADHESALMTVTDYDAFTDLVPLEAANLTTDQKVFLIKLASSRLVTALNNNIVICGFTKTMNGEWQTSAFLREGLPVIDFDPPRVSFPLSLAYQLYPTDPGPKLVWNLNPITGQLKYKPAQNVVNWPEPWSQGNEVKISYYAGNWNLPTAIIGALIQIIVATLENRAGIKALKTGSFQVTYLDRGALQAAIAELEPLYGL